MQLEKLSVSPDGRIESPTAMFLWLCKMLHLNEEHSGGFFGDTSALILKF